MNLPTEVQTPTRLTADPAYRTLEPGEPAPWFEQRCTSNPRFLFETVGGRYVVLGFFGSAASAPGGDALRWVREHRGLFDDTHISLFGVSLDPEDERSGRVAPLLPGVRHFWDFDGWVNRLYGALPQTPGPAQEAWRGLWVVLDPSMAVLASIPFKPDRSDQAQLRALLEALPPVPSHAGVDMHAPVLVAPNVLTADLRLALLDYFERHGGEPSGFMREVGGHTVEQLDPRYKRRNDCHVEDEMLQRELRRQICLKLKPLLFKAHCFEVTRIERYLIGCYDAKERGHFEAHRDNTTPGTAHRRFALSVNLNEDFDGGEVVFPEYGPRGYKLPPGCGLVFSGALLHKVEPVRQGRRLAVLPFLYDEAAARLREANSATLPPGVKSFEFATDDLLEPSTG